MIADLDGTDTIDFAATDSVSGETCTGQVVVDQPGFTVEQLRHATLRQRQIRAFILATRPSDRLA